MSGVRAIFQFAKSLDIFVDFVVAIDENASISNVESVKELGVVSNDNQLQAMGLLIMTTSNEISQRFLPGR